MKRIAMILCFVLCFASLAFARQVTLTWTAPSDNPSGNVSGYFLVYSEQPITELNFGDCAILATNAAKPAGQQESYSYDLAEGKRYYFAIKAIDSSYNKSVMSNVVSVDFLAPNPITDLSFTLQ